MELPVFLAWAVIGAVICTTTDGLLSGHSEQANFKTSGTNCSLVDGSTESRISWLDLKKAISHQDLLEVISILRKGVCIRCDTLWELTPILHFASQFDSGTIVRTLVNFGVEVGCKDTEGNTALHVAVRSCKEAVVQALLELGGEPDAVNSHGLTPLLAALLDHPGCDLSRVVALLLASGANLNQTSPAGMTPLHAAVYRRNTQLVYPLITAGACLNCREANGWTPLHFAAMLGLREPARLLLQSGAVPNVMDKQGLTPLYFAKLECHKEVEHLIERWHGITFDIPIDVTSTQDTPVTVRASS